MAEKNFQMRRKLAGGGFDDYFPITKATNVKMPDGVTTVEDELGNTIFNETAYPNPARRIKYGTAIADMTQRQGELLVLADRGGATANCYKYDPDTGIKATTTYPSANYCYSCAYNPDDDMVYYMRQYSNTNYVYRYTSAGAQESKTNQIAKVHYMVHWSGLDFYTVSFDGSLYRYRWADVATTVITTLSFLPSNVQIRSLTKANGYLYALANNSKIYKFTTAGVLVATFDISLLYCGAAWGLEYYNGKFYLVGGVLPPSYSNLGYLFDVELD